MHADADPPRRITLAEAPAAAATLARALADDPGWVHVFPDDAVRPDRMRRMLDLLARRVYVPAGEAWQVGAAAGAALWIAPGVEDVSTWQAVRLAPRLAWLIGRRLGAALDVYRAMEARHPTEPHWYLAVLGIDPAHQGRGLGPRLVAPILDRCDRDRTLAWLESTNPRNHGFYRRLGFEVAHAHPLPGGPTITFFARRPR